MQKILKHLSLWSITLISGLCFFYLLAIKTGFFDKQTDLSQIHDFELNQQTQWMNIFQNNKKIGYTKKQIKIKKDSYVLIHKTYMKINTMGVIQDMHIDTKGFFNKDHSLSAFEFKFNSDLFKFFSKGEIKDNLLTIDVDNKIIEIPVTQPLYLSENISKLAYSLNLKTEQSETFKIFDAASMGNINVKLTMKGYENIDVMGKKQKTMKLLIDYKGAIQTAWIDLNGDIVQETGFLGLCLKKTNEYNALNNVVDSSTELTKLASVDSNIKLDNIENIKRIIIKISGIDSIDCSSQRQNFSNNILTIEKENNLDNNKKTLSFENNKYLTSTPLIQSDHPLIIDKVSEIVSKDDNDLTKAKKITKWLYNNIQKKPVISVPNALETLKNKMGDCNEHSALMAAMTRAANIPSKIEAGLVYLKGRFYYHAWNSIYIGKWITVDSLMGQIPADITHICLVSGGLDKQLDIIKAIGNIKLDILSYEFE